MILENYLKNRSQRVVLNGLSSDDYPELTFSGNQFQQCSSQKQVRLFLDNKLDFNKYLDEKINNCNKIIGMMKNSPIGFQKKLLTTYKLFFRQILDYANIFYDKPYKGSFREKIERV